MKKDSIQMVKLPAMVKIPEEWLVDYQPARERAIRWLGDRYLFARDIPRLSPARASSPSGRTGTGRPLHG